MAKKSKNKNLSEQIVRKRGQQNAPKKVNPFEVHTNREKLTILGKKKKVEKGLPGVSRKRALEKRKNTLLREYQLQDKTNKFLDKRIGEHSSMPVEERVGARYAAVRIKAHSKNSIFNLASDEVLTHRGQTISEIEKFENPQSDEDDILDDDGKLDSNFVENAHFGGGILSHSEKDGANSHKNLIDMLIAESKKRKAEKQKTREHTLELTQKLDTEWRDLIPLVTKNVRTQEKAATRTNTGDYDKMIKELQFEARGHPSERLKTEDEIAKEEKEKLERLEKERLDRMRGFVSTNDKKGHRGADDLDDNFAYDSEPDVTLTYNDAGESNINLKAEMNKQSGGEENAEDEEEEDDDDDDDNDEDSNSEDNLSDLKDESEDDEETDVSKHVIGEKESSVTQDNNHSNDEDRKTQIRLDLLKRKELMEKAREELPYTYNFSDSFESLQDTLVNQSCYNQGVIIERMIKCHHPSLSENNKEKLGTLFTYLLQYLDNLASDIQNEQQLKDCFSVFKILVPYFFELAQLNNLVYKTVVEVIKMKQTNYRKNKKVFPDIGVLLLLKLVSCLYSTSDFRHQVVTPCAVFIDQMLTTCRIQSKKDITYGLFLVTLFLEYSALSKRFLPSAIIFLSGILHMAVPKIGVQLIKVPPPFKPISNNLVLNEDCSTKPVNLMDVMDLIGVDTNEEFKIRTLTVTFNLLKEFNKNFSELPSSLEIFELALKYLQLIPLSKYPKEVESNGKELVNELEELKAARKLEFLLMEKKKPKALRLYEPNIQKVVEGKRHKPMSKEKAETNKLLHKVKREYKGAVREIRRDKAFLAKVKINQRIQSDKERYEKVKRIYAEANVQQSELNALERKNKRKK